MFVSQWINRLAKHLKKLFRRYPLLTRGLLAILAHCPRLRHYLARTFDIKTLLPPAAAIQSGFRQPLAQHADQLDNIGKTLLQRLRNTRTYETTGQQNANID